MSARRFEPDALLRLASDILRAVGVPGASATLVADSLVQAELWGHHSHGLLRLPWYVARLRSGATKATAAGEVLIDTGALVLLDGQDGLGQVMAERARDLAVERARVHGIGAVGVRNSNHFGTAMYFTRRAAREGCVALLTTNASPAMAPWGGKEKRVGTNPWSIAGPWRDSVVALDIANTAVARGKLYLAKQRGEPIPSHWALDSEGAPTTDAVAGIAGTIMPMAGHKGYAISFMMDLLSGALTGSAVGTGVIGPYMPDGSSGAGHLMIAIDVAALGPVEDYDSRVDAMVREVRETPLAVGHDRIHHPGELEDLAEAAARAAGGVELPEQTIAELGTLADDLGVALPAGWSIVASVSGATP
ncbi:Ldh family oxidoreductase [Agrococcus terreus]|uniref:Lactate dehydrogenase n=1 Tax=Agrococcus terreus TaxID=574649 RepID=A0ABQ2KJP5_9MICO|nr:Ldh family oxidoreductase [Agrococcus terreus]GGN84981.1 lactate dehydrogenase [Agrococcus terreus]